MINLHITSPGTELHTEGSELYITTPKGTQKYAIRYIACLYICPNVVLNSKLILTFFEADKPLYFTREQGHIGAGIYQTRFGVGVHTTQQQLLMSITNRAKLWALTCVQQKHARRCKLLAEFHQKNIISAAQYQKYSIAAVTLATEGSVDRHYWSLVRKIIPLQWGFEKREHRGTQSPANALLNYLYGMLYHSLERLLMRRHLDPYIGFHHSNKRGQKAFLFDAIEGFRPWIEAIWLETIKAKPQAHSIILEGKIPIELRKYLGESYQDYLYAGHEKKVLRIKILEEFVNNTAKTIRNDKLPPIV